MLLNNYFLTVNVNVLPGKIYLYIMKSIIKFNKDLCVKAYTNTNTSRMNSNINALKIKNHLPNHFYEGL